MVRTHTIVISALLFAFIFAGCAKSEEPVTNILAAADSLEKKLEWVDYRLSLEQWEYDRNGFSDSLSFYNDLYLYLISANDLYNNSSNGANIKDRTDKQRLQILVSETITDRIEARPALVAFKDSLNRMIDSFKVDFQGEVKSLSQIKDTYFNSRSRSQREMACRAWYSVGENLSPGITKLIKSRNEAAARLGFENYWDLLSSQFAQNGIDILQFIKSVDSLTQTAYSKLLDDARSSLGVNQIEIWDVPFEHSQIKVQGDAFFPIDSQLTYAKRGLKSVGFNLDQLPIFIEEVSKSDPDFDFTSYAVKPPHDIRLLTKSHTGFDSMQSLMRQLGVALYSIYIAQERPLYNYAADTTWQMAMGEIMAAMACDSAWLNGVANLPLGFILQFRKVRIEQEIINIRTLLANINFIYQAHTNPDRDLNQLYWELYQKYTGLPRHDDIIVWATIPELMSDPMIPVRQLLAKSIAAQSVNYMTSYFGPLLNNHNTSSFLVQNYFRFGSRYAWSELLQRGTGEKLSPIHLMKLLEL